MKVVPARLHRTVSLNSPLLCQISLFGRFAKRFNAAAHSVDDDKASDDENECRRTPTAGVRPVIPHINKHKISLLNDDHSKCTAAHRLVVTICIYAPFDSSGKMLNKICKCTLATIQCCQWR